MCVCALENNNTLYTIRTRKSCSYKKWNKSAARFPIDFFLGRHSGWCVSSHLLLCSLCGLQRVQRVLPFRFHLPSHIHMSRNKKMACLTGADLCGCLSGHKKILKSSKVVELRWLEDKIVAINLTPFRTSNMATTTHSHSLAVHVIRMKIVIYRMHDIHFVKYN